MIYIIYWTNIVKNLKERLDHDNPAQIRKGKKQLQGYVEELEKVYGGKWSSILDTY